MDPTSRTKPRRTPRQQRSQQLVDALVTAATRVLATDGVDGATTWRIAEVAGVSEGSLYQYFPTKAALLAAVLERQAKVELESFESQASELAALPFADAVRRVVSAFVDAHVARPRLHRELLAAMEQLERRSFVNSLVARFVDRATARLKARSAELGLDDPEATAFVLVHAVHATVHAAAEHRPELFRQDRLRHALERLVLRYVGL